MIIEGKVHFDDISETPHVNLKINVAACKDESMCPALDPSDSPSLQSAEGDVNMVEEAGRELDTSVELVVYSVCHNELEGTSQKCSAEKDKEKSCGSDILETVSCAMLVRKVEEASADALLLSANEASVKQRTKACCTYQPMDPRMGQSDASSLWIVEGDVNMLEESDVESLYRNANGEGGMTVAEEGRREACDRSLGGQQV
ncbi:unnamed protein product [Sphagnum jensenii]|uniref:Uncharacterized protein n=1 Tax=Sphagnum jensenii TaxID=128206 RepID=A0ABP1ADR3_9BRYO